jgi:hypothetical protein
MHSCIQGGATPWLGKTHRQILSALSLQRRKPHDDGRNTGRICSGRASIDKTQPAIERPRRRAGGNGLIKGLHLYIPTAVELRYCITKQRLSRPLLRRCFATASQTISFACGSITMPPSSDLLSALPASRHKRRVVADCRAQSLLKRGFRSHGSKKIFDLARQFDPGGIIR